MKTIPTLRDKKRYLAFEITSEKPLNRQELNKEILSSIVSLFGDSGLSEISPALMSFDGKSGIIRCMRDRTRELRAALACIVNSHGMCISILVHGISGTIKGATEKFIQTSFIKEVENK